MDILTDGGRFATPQAVRYGPTEPIRLQRICERVEARRRSQWWGDFDAGDSLELDVDTDALAGLRIEILDRGFEPMAVVAGLTTSWHARTELGRGGVTYLRVHNLAPWPVEVVLSLTCCKAVTAVAAERPLLRPGLAFLRHLRQAA